MELDYAEGSSRSSFTKNNNNRNIRGNCYNCGKPGHYAKDCHVKTKARANQIEETVSTSSRQNDNAELAVINDNCEQLLKFNEKVNGYNAWILLDSGASRNFIDNKFVEKNHLQ